jgi:Tfp pilus assembly protein PilE
LILGKRVTKLYKKRNGSGFTIIEVALVLAIAALIFLVVFLAVPALQRNQRDDARRRDVATASTLIQTWLANNGGRFSHSETDRANLRKYMLDNMSSFYSFSNNQNNLVYVSTNKNVKMSIKINESTQMGNGEQGTYREAYQDSLNIFPSFSCNKTSVPEQINFDKVSTSQFCVVTVIEAGGGTFYWQNI